MVEFRDEADRKRYFENKEAEKQFEDQAVFVSQLARQVLTAFEDALTPTEAWNLAKQAVFNRDAIYILPDQYPSVVNEGFHQALKYLHRTTGAVFQPLYDNKK